MTREELQRRTAAGRQAKEEQARKRAEEEAERKRQEELIEQKRRYKRRDELIREIDEAIGNAADRGESSYTNDDFPDYDPMFREAVLAVFADLTRTIEFKIVKDEIFNYRSDGEHDGTSWFQNTTHLTISW